MARKVKPNSLLDSVPVEQTTEETTKENTAFKDSSLVGNGIMTAEMKEKLEKYDALEQSYSSIVKEKEDLENRVAEYAERLAELKTAADQIHDLMDENAKLKKQLSDASKLSKDSASLQLEVKALRDDVDGYLLKISELTFENANLTCQLDELNNRLASNGVSPNQKKFAPNNTPPVQNGLRQPRVDAYNPYSHNGYSSWN